MSKVDLKASTYRIIPSHYPPIQLFENLLDPADLEDAYALESLTNDRLRDEVGDIALVAPGDRITGPGTSPIMAAFTHAGIESRFTDGRYGVYYAGLDLQTALAESQASRARFMSTTNEEPQIITMRCYQCDVDAEMVDLRHVEAIHNPENYSAAQQAGLAARKDGAAGILYRSVRHPGGECIAALKPTAMKPPATQAGHFNYHWDGERIANVTRVTIVG